MTGPSLTQAQLRVLRDPNGWATGSDDDDILDGLERSGLLRWDSSSDRFVVTPSGLESGGAVSTSTITVSRDTAVAVCESALESSRLVHTCRLCEAEEYGQNTTIFDLEHRPDCAVGTLIAKIEEPGKPEET